MSGGYSNNNYNFPITLPHDRSGNNQQSTHNANALPLIQQQQQMQTTQQQAQQLLASMNALPSLLNNCNINTNNNSIPNLVAQLQPLLQQQTPNLHNVMADTLVKGTAMQLNSTNNGNNMFS